MQENSDVAALATVLRNGNKNEMNMSSSQLAHMGAPAVSTLIDVIVESEKARLNALDALIQIGAPSVPPLIELLQTNNDVWNYASAALSKIGEPSVEPLIDVLANAQDKKVLSRAVPALGGIGAPAIQPLHNALKENRLTGQGRLYAAITLEEFGQSAIPSLEMLATDGNAAVRYIATETLAKFTEQPKPKSPVSPQPTITKEPKVAQEEKVHHSWFHRPKLFQNRPAAPTDMSSTNVPIKYDPKLHYNCFVETVPARDRQAVYQELRRRGFISFSYILNDGRLQLSVLNLRAGIEAYNAVAKDKVLAAGITKARLIQLMAMHPDMEVTFIEKTHINHVLHAEKAPLSQLVVPSEGMFRKGVSHHEKQQYNEAIACYDEAIKIEPDDVRAWNNKILALGQLGKHQDALLIANNALERYPDISLLWEAKGNILYALGRMIESGDCYSKACQMDPTVAKKHEKHFAPEDKLFQKLLAECKKSGKNPETAVHFWFEKFTKYVNSSESEAAMLCLQMAARSGPNYIVLSSATHMALLEPWEDFLLSDKLRPVDAKVERLGDFFDKLVTQVMKRS
jgi:tetratricopeptide (TPR) repeat protein